MGTDRPGKADDLRTRAEALLEKSPDAFQPEDIQDVNVLANELAMHQAELELQNEELRRTQMALQETRDRFAALFEHAPVGYVVLDSSGIIRQANATWCDMTDRRDEDFRGTPFVDMIMEDDATVFLSRFRAFFRNPTEKQIVVRIKRGGGRHFYGQIEAKERRVEPASDDAACPEELMVIVSDITKYELAKEALKKIEWMLSEKPPVDQSIQSAHDLNDQGYENLTTLNRDGLILRSIGKSTLSDISAEFLNLLESSGAIYEKNGDYAYGIFSSGWCRLMDSASRKLCRTDDNETALASGRWLCHESCWSDCSKRAIESQSPVDIQCNGGINLYAVPIYSAGEVIGAINFGYGDPPRDPVRLQSLADAYELDPEVLAHEAHAYASRPAYIIELAKQKLLSSARLIGIMVERKQAEEALRASEELHRTTLSSIGDGVISTDADGRVVTMNPVAEHMTGWKNIEASGQDLTTVFRIINSKTRQTVANPVAKVIATGHVVGLANHTILIARDGTERQIADSAAPIRNGSEEVLGVVLVFRDVTDEYAAAEKLQASETDLRQAQRVAHIGSWCFDLNTKAVTTSEEARRIYGLGDRDMTIPEVQTVPLRKYREPLDNALRALVEKGEDYDVEFQIRRLSDGAIRAIHSVAEYLPEMNVVIGTIQDITERKEAETALRESEELLDAAGRMARVGGWELDTRTQEVTWTKATYDIHDLPSTCKPPLEEAINFFHPEDRPTLQRAIEDAIAHGKPYDLELRFITAKGRQLITRTQCTPVLEDSRIVKLRGTFQDITELRQVEERLRHMEKMDAIGQLAGGVAHDFNNQLGGIMGYAGMLRTRLEDPGLRTYAENILACSHRASDLTAQLLAFARKGQYQSVPVDMHDVIHDVVEFLNHSIDKKIEIKQVLTASPGVTRGDPTHLQNALLNLAINAADSMQDGGELLFETANAELDADYCAGVPYDIEPGSYLHLCVSDTGCGIPKENLERIFEPFFTTKEVGKGTGMGLAAVFGMVKQHGGAINVYSEIGQGTTFRLYLPLEAETAHHLQETEQTQPAARDAVILVVDDEQVIRDVAEELLADLGYRVTVRDHGESALAYFREHWREIDLVILDMVMPRMNGTEAFRAMQKINPVVKVLLSSGYSAGGTARDLLAEGVLGFIQKPFSPAQLSTKVAEVLQIEAP